MGFVKFDSGKAPLFELSAYDRGVLENESKLLAIGASRYGRANWRLAKIEEGIEKYSSALGRHYLAILDGEVVDPDTGLPHTTAIRCNAGFLEWFLGERERLQGK